MDFYYAQTSYNLSNFPNIRRNRSRSRNWHCWNRPLWIGGYRFAGLEEIFLEVLGFDHLGEDRVCIAVLIRCSRSQGMPTSSALPVGICAANEKLLDKQLSKKLVATRILRVIVVYVLNFSPSILNIEMRSARFRS